MATTDSPQLSADRRWFWDGENWLPYVPDPEPLSVATPSATPVDAEPATPSPAVPPSPGRGRWTIALVVSLAVLWTGSGALLFVLHSRTHAAALTPFPSGASATPLPTADPSLPAIPPGTLIGFSPTWAPSDSVATLTPVAAGVDYTLKEGGLERYATPTSNTLQAMRIDADVTLVRGDASFDGVGLGCTNIDGSAVVYFYLFDDHITVRQKNGDTWSVPAQVATGLDRTGGQQHLTMLCDSRSAGTAHVMIAVSGTTVVDRTMALPRAQWWGPVISLCSCGGPSEATYRNLRESYLSGR